MKPIMGNRAKYPNKGKNLKPIFFAIYTKSALVPIQPTKNKKDKEKQEMPNL